jgi:hypothetical protein
MIALYIIMELQDMGGIIIKSIVILCSFVRDLRIYFPVTHFLLTALSFFESYEYLNTKFLKHSKLNDIKQKATANSDGALINCLRQPEKHITMQQQVLEKSGICYL